MKHAVIAIAIASLLLVSGCVQSLQPLYTESTTITDSTLIGRWVDEKEGNVWQFSQGEGRSYVLEYTEDNAPSSFEIHIVRLGRFRFVDFFPNEANIANELYKNHLLPTHSFARLVQHGDTLKLFFLNHEWIKRMAGKKRLTIPAQSVNGRYVLTGSTLQLQAFVREIASRKDAFMEPLILKRGGN
jgi:hypothetical protein